jgi:hypothetical protein
MWLSLEVVLMNREEMKERIEELENKVEELENRSTEDVCNGPEDDRVLYLYLRYELEEVESILGTFSRYQYLVLHNEEDGYHIPKERVFKYMSHTAQAQELVKKYVDCWDEIELVASSEDAIYYCATVPASEADSAREGSWTPRDKLNNILSDFKEAEYLLEI